MPIAATIVALAVTPVTATTATAAGTDCAPTWQLVSTDEFRGADALARSQGATTDGHGWYFSWQGGLERTDDSYVDQAAGTWPAQQAADPQVNPNGTNHLGNNHLG